MSGAGIEAPYTITSLPRPLDRKHGRIQASSVFGLGGSRKRKRHEVAVGIDGEGVTIYNIQSQSQVTSYALPPQTYLCCAPCSVYCRRTTTSPAQRTTYLVTKESAADSRRRLLCFRQDVGNKRASDVEFSAPTRTECKIQDGEVAGVDILPSASDVKHPIILTYQNGETFSVSSGLEKIQPLGQPQLEKSDDYEVEHVDVSDAETARKGILQGREDVLALLDQNGTTGTGATLLCYFIRSHHERHLRLYHLRDLHQQLIQSQTPSLQLLMSYDLYSPKKHNAKQQDAPVAKYELHSSSGMLYQLLDGKLGISDMSGTIPKLLTVLGNRSAPVNSFARISASLVLVISNDTASLHETKYGSASASVSLIAGKTSVAHSKKRKRDDQDADVVSSTAICTISSNLGLVVGVCDHELVALQLNDASRGSKRAKSAGTRLADVIGKGARDQTHNANMNEKQAQRWKEWTAKVDALVENSDTEGLEKLVANENNLGGQKKIKKKKKMSSKDNAASAEQQNGDAAADQDLWPIQIRVNPQTITRRRVLYILAKIFAFKDSETGGLEIRIRSSKLLQWLALIGFLTLPYVRMALQQFSQGADRHESAIIMPGDIMAAILQIDADFQILHDLLSLRVHWDIVEIVQALRLLVQSFEAPPADEAQPALPAPQHDRQRNDDLEMTNGNDTDTDSNPEVELESRAAEHELDHAMSALTTGLEVRSDTLRKVLARLHAFPQPLVASTMRDMLSHEELIFFIHILRIELADGGWTSKYIDGLAGEDEMPSDGVGMSRLEELEPSDHGIARIGGLMNCAVEAIGIGGWLVGLSNDVRATEELMDSLRAEISAGVEGCFEADQLATFLEELVQYALEAEKPQLPRLEKQRSEDGDGIDEEALLPLGPLVKPIVGRIKTGDGGKKSHGALTKEKRMLVGKYSFERIRI